MIPAIEKIRRDLEYRTPVLGMSLTHIVLERQQAIELMEWIDRFHVQGDVVGAEIERHGDRLVGELLRREDRRIRRDHQGVNIRSPRMWRSMNTTPTCVSWRLRRRHPNLLFPEFETTVWLG